MSTWQVIQGDSLDVLMSLPDCSVDAVITDPPYCSGGQFRSEIVQSTNVKYRGWSQNEDGSARTPTAFYSAFGGDNKDGRVFLAWSKQWMSEAFRVAKDGAFIALTTDWRQLPAVTDMMQFAGWTWRGIVVWDKKIGRPVKGRFRNHIEYVVWGSRGGFSSEQEVYPGSLHSETPPGHRDRVHVTEKPTGLIHHVCSVISKDAVVLDPFCGSGSTGVACAESGRGFIGIEIDQKNCEIARKRIADAVPLCAGGTV